MVVVSVSVSGYGCSIMSVCGGHDMVVVSCQCVGGMIWL